MNLLLIYLVLFLTGCNSQPVFRVIAAPAEDNLLSFVPQGFWITNEDSADLNQDSLLDKLILS